MSDFLEILKHFGIQGRNPLSPSGIRSVSDVLQTSEHQVAVQRITDAGNYGEMQFVIGPHGTGKTTALDAAIDRLTKDKKCKICRVLQPDTDVLRISHIVSAIGRAMGTKYQGYDRGRILEEIQSILNSPNATPLLVVIDDGHALHRNTLFAIKRTWDNVKVGYQRMIGFVILAQPQIMSVLNLDIMHEIRDHTNVSQIFGLLSNEEIGRYLKIKFRSCGGWDKFFDPNVPEQIWKHERLLSNSDTPSVTPRHLNAQIQRAMQCACELGETRITKEHIDAIYASQ